MQTVVPVANTAVGEQPTATTSTSSNNISWWTLSWKSTQIIVAVCLAIFLFSIIFGGIYFSDSLTTGNCPTGCEPQTCVDPSRCYGSGPDDCNDKFECTCGYDVEGCVGRDKTVFVNDWHKHDIGISFLVIGIVGFIVSGCSMIVSVRFASYGYGPCFPPPSENYYGNPNIPNIPVDVNQQTTAPSSVMAPQNNLGNYYPQTYPQPYAQPPAQPYAQPYAQPQQMQYAAVPQQTYQPTGGYNTVHQGVPVQGTIIGPTGAQAAQYQSTGTGVIQGTVVYAAV